MGKAWRTKNLRSSPSSHLHSPSSLPCTICVVCVVHWQGMAGRVPRTGYRAMLRQMLPCLDRNRLGQAQPGCLAVASYTAALLVCLACAGLNPRWPTRRLSTNIFKCTSRPQAKHTHDCSATEPSYPNVPHTPTLKATSMPTGTSKLLLHTCPSAHFSAGPFEGSHDPRNVWLPTTLMRSPNATCCSANTTFRLRFRVTRFDFSALFM